MHEDHDFDAFDGREFFFGEELDLFGDAGVYDDEVVEVRLVLWESDGHGIVEEFHVGELVVHFSILCAQIESQHTVFYNLYLTGPIELFLWLIIARIWNWTARIRIYRIWIKYFYWVSFSISKSNYLIIIS